MSKPKRARTEPIPISSMTSTQLAEYFQKLGSYRFPGTAVYLDSEQVAQLIGASGATHETLKYGIPIEGLSPLQRCTLFTWLNKGERLGDGEKLLFPILEIPNKAVWSEEQFDWFLFVGFGIERACVEPWSTFINVISVKIWGILEMIRGTDSVNTTSIRHLINLGSLEDLRAFVSKSVQFSLEPLKKPENMIKFMKENNVVADEDEVLVKKFEKAQVNIDKLRFGLCMPGISFEERCVIFEKLAAVDVLVGTNILKCPSVLWPINFFQDKARLSRYMALSGIKGSDGLSREATIKALSKMIMQVKQKVKDALDVSIDDQLIFKYSFHDSQAEANIRKFLLFSEHQGADYVKFCGGLSH